MQVDHNPRFELLMADWLRALNKKAEDIAITFSSTYETSSAIDGSLVASWIAYHRDNARLRILCAKCNLSMPRNSPR